MSARPVILWANRWVCTCCGDGCNCGCASICRLHSARTESSPLTPGPKA